MALFLARVRTVLMGEPSANLPTGVGFNVKVHLRILGLTAETVILRHGLGVLELTVRATPVVHGSLWLPSAVLFLNAI